MAAPRSLPDLGTPRIGVEPSRLAARRGGTRAFSTHGAAAFATRRVVGLAALLVLVGLSALLRARELDASLWIDEAIAAGIAAHPAAEIPDLLRQDGSPPVYFLLLHGWTGLAGTSESALRAPSLLFALLTIPAAFWAGRGLLGTRAGWLSAGFAAVVPFLTAYAGEARMYTLVVLLSVLATTSFLHAFVFARRRHLPAFALVLGLLLYTHYWALFFALGALAALGWLVATAPRRARGSLLRDGMLGFAPPALAFAPWTPTLASQLAHTGAPWSRPAPPSVLLSALALGIVAVLVARLGRDHVERRTLQALALVAATVLGAAWASTQLEPAWAGRYLAVLGGPLLLLAGGTLACLGRLGLAAAGAVILVWAVDVSPRDTGNVREAVAAVAARLEPGDLVVSTQPEQVPVLALYLPPGTAYATPLGPVDSPVVMDWRDASRRLERARPRAAIRPLLDMLPRGARVLLVTPAERPEGPVSAWAALVAKRTSEWEEALARDARLDRLELGAVARGAPGKSIRLALYRKTGCAACPDASSHDGR